MRPQRSTAVAIAAASVALAGDIGLHGDAFATRLRGQHRGLLGRDKVAVDSKDHRSFLREAHSTVARPLPIPSRGLCCERDGLIRPQCRRIIRRNNLDDLIAFAGSTRRRGRPTGRLGP